MLNCFQSKWVYLDMWACLCKGMPYAGRLVEETARQFGGDSLEMFLCYICGSESFKLDIYVADVAAHLKRRRLEERGERRKERDCIAHHHIIFCYISYSIATRSRRGGHNLKVPRAVLKPSDVTLAHAADEALISDSSGVHFIISSYVALAHTLHVERRGVGCER